MICNYFGWSKKQEKQTAAQTPTCNETVKSPPATTTTTSSSDNIQENTASNLITLSQDMNWNELILSSTYIICRYTATWCKPCKAIEPTFYKIAQENKGIKFITIDVDEHEELFHSMGILGIPHLQFYINGELKTSLSGNNAVEIQEVIDKYMK